MTDDEPKKKNPIGATGQTVADNVKRLRGGQNLTFTELAKRLEALGKPIPTLGLRHIEARKRRVDSDDLVALAAALGVSPISLLMPASERPDDPVSITAEDATVPAGEVWAWLTAADALNTPGILQVLGPQLRYGHFGQLAWPDWVREDEMRRNRDELLQQLRDIQEQNRGDDQ